MSVTADLSLQASSALPSSDGGPSPLRPISFSDPEITVDRRADGTIYLRPQRLDIEYPLRLTDSLRYWATVAPDRLFRFWQQESHMSCNFLSERVKLRPHFFNAF